MAPSHIDPGLTPPITPPLQLEETAEAKSNASRLPHAAGGIPVALPVISSPHHFRRLAPLLTLEEKIKLLSGSSLTSTTAIPRLGIPALKVSDSISGVRGSQSHLDDKGTACFPSPTCLASTWNKGLMQRFGVRVGIEAKHKTVQVVLGPNINLHRDPRGGRNFETFSEDPLLSGQLAANIINGIQSEGVGACVKHFVANECETLRKSYDVAESVHGRTMRELYIGAFQHLLRHSNPASIMMAYNKLDGIHCSESSTIKSLLRHAWGWDGCVMSDWYATTSTGAAIAAGLDLEMPGPTVFRGAALAKAVTDGTVDVKDIDQAVQNILGLIDQTARSHSTEDERTVISNETSAMAKQLASEGIVLLENRNNVLPLDMRTAPRIAVIGTPAVQPTTTGGGSACAHPQYTQRPLDCIRDLHPYPDTVKYASGPDPYYCIPLASPSLLRNSKGNVGAHIDYYNSAESEPVFSEDVVAPVVVMIGRLKPGLNETGFHFVMTTNLTPTTSGLHNLAVQVTGPFELYCNDKLILSADPPKITVEDFLFIPKKLEHVVQVSMASDQTYNIRLLVHSREMDNNHEVCPHAAKLCFQEEVDDEAAIAEARDLAAASDISIIYSGRTQEHESEGFDLTTTAIPAKQVQMIKSVAAASKKTILVLHGGNPIDVSPFIDEVDAVLFAHFPGQEGGQAVADIIAGKANPSGKLATSWPNHFGADCMATFDNFTPRDVDGVPTVTYAEGLQLGYRHKDAAKMHRYAFGYGLSYSAFKFENLRVSHGNEEALKYGERTVMIKVEVRNKGPLPGQEVVQVYCAAPSHGSIWRPAKELKGFTKVFLLPGEAKTVQVEIPRRDLAGVWDEEKRCWRSLPGEYQVLVGELKGSVILEDEQTWTGL